MKKISSICVFCGSNTGNNKKHIVAAKRLGTLIAQKGLTLVYGGGKVGLMGIIADAVINKGGKVIGVIPKHLANRGIVHTGITKLHIVNGMHQRKALMSKLSDAFIAMPGGIGTLEEFIEVVAWSSLGLHKKTFGLLNTAGYFNSLINFFKHITNEGFYNKEHSALIFTKSTPATLLDEIIKHAK
ncbi:MAG: TIGR00730 family Rossman fold protein [Endomicrobiales bacterium]|nr:TIGR00730 family Rossman fold protein [Endomicrobiales bacterium]